MLYLLMNFSTGDSRLVVESFAVSITTRLRLS